MQSWNQWQLSTGAISTPMPQTSGGYTTQGSDPMAIMQAYMQYYNQPAPSGYTAEQWAAAQQQNWAQWQQWQQQYQQWQAQYGEKYQETMKQISAQNMNLANQISQLPIAQAPPPLPKEDTKPPLPPTPMNMYHFTSMPPPHQNNLPLFPIKQDADNSLQQISLQNGPQNPPLPLGQPPLPPESDKSNVETNTMNGKCSSSTINEPNNAKKLKLEDDELTEAERTFDAQFKQWEEQFHKWKQQNANHPDKVQYKQYEAKWTSWREKLIERREQMRRKREQQKQAAMKAEVEKSKTLTGGNKLMNILTSTENQGLINNLLGIGKTLGLTGKQNTNVPPPPPPPPSTETENKTNIQGSTVTPSTSGTPQSSTHNPSTSNVPNSSPWNSQQWSSQYNAGLNSSNFPNFQSVFNDSSFPSPATQMPPPNFMQPPPNFSAMPNFSQPPPGFPDEDSRQNRNVRSTGSSNLQSRPPPFDMNSGNGQDGTMMHGERSNQMGLMNNTDGIGFQNNFGTNNPIRQKEGMSSDRFGRDRMNDPQFRYNEAFTHRSDNYKMNNDNDGDQYRRDERNHQNFNSDRFNPGNDPFRPGNRFGPMNDKFRSMNDRFGLGDGRSNSGNNGSINDQYRTNESYGPGGDRFVRNTMDRFDRTDMGDNRRDSFSNNGRGFNRSNQFDSSDKFAPELKTLMEKRRVAVNVFKPSYTDSEKNLNVSSLSESFKRITGDSPFIKPNGNNSFEARGPPNFGPATSGNFRMSGDLGQIGVRCSNSFDSRDGGVHSFNSNTQQVQDILNNGPRQDMTKFGDSGDINNDKKNDLRINEQTNIDSTQKGQRDPSEKEEIPFGIYSTTDKDLQKAGCESMDGKQELSEKNNSVNKKTEALPFMGEKDSKPEDLYMEPPPELPNLEPMTKDTGDGTQRTNEPYEVNESTAKSFLGSQTYIDSRGASDVSIGSRGMQFTSNAQFPWSRGSNDSRYPIVGPRGPTTFAFNLQGPKGHIFGSRDSHVDTSSSRTSNTGYLDSRGPNEAPFNRQGNNDRPFGSRESMNSQFAPRDFDNEQFGTRASNSGQFGPRADTQMGLRRSADGRFNINRSNDGQFGPRNLNARPFGPGKLNDDSFDNHASDSHFISKGPNDGPSRFSGPNDRLFGTRRGDPPYQSNPSVLKGTTIGQFGNRFNEKQFESNSINAFESRGPLDRTDRSCNDNRQFDARGIGEFRRRGPKDGPNSDDKDVFNNSKQMDMQQGRSEKNEMQGSRWRQSFSKNVFGDTDQRSRRDFDFTDKPLSLQNDGINQDLLSNMEKRSGNMTNLSENLYMKRSRCPTIKEFCIERQFNYNHVGTGVEKKFVDFIPTKVMDYAHTTRSTIQDHFTPVQCFDYGHGSLKPVVPEHEIYPKKDFRNWVENEQNLKEYTEKIKGYGYYTDKIEYRGSRDYNQRRDNEEIKEERNERRYERDRREKEDYKMKDIDDRIFDQKPEKEQDTRHEKNLNRERIRERNESSQKDVLKEGDKNEDRSKGNTNWQENSNKNAMDIEPLESSVAEITSQNVLEPQQKTLELPKTPNCTMVDDLLCPPGRQNRPPKIAIILRGPPGSGKSFVAKLIKDKEVEQGGCAPRILCLDDYFLVEKETESVDDNGKKITTREIVYEYEEAMESSYIASLSKAFKKNVTCGFFNFIILDCINEKISDYEELWSFAKTEGFKVYVCEMEMDLQICLKRNIHDRTEDEINRIIDYFEPTPSYHQKLDVNSLLQEQAIEEVHMEDSEETPEKPLQQNEDSQDSQDDTQDEMGVSKWERMEAEDKLDRLDGLAKKKNEGKVQTMKDFLQVPDYYNMEDTSGKKRVRWADLEECKEQEKMRAVGFVVGHTNWDRMMDPTKGGSALTRTKYI